MTDAVTIEISPANRYLRLWVARWQSGDRTCATEPVPADLLAQRLSQAIEAQLGELDQRHGPDTAGP
jgi:hypothetical protein